MLPHSSNWRCKLILPLCLYLTRAVEINCINWDQMFYHFRILLYWTFWVPLTWTFINLQASKQTSNKQGVSEPAALWCWLVSRFQTNINSRRNRKRLLPAERTTKDGRWTMNAQARLVSIRWNMTILYDNKHTVFSAVDSFCLCIVVQKPK